MLRAFWSGLLLLFRLPVGTQSSFDPRSCWIRSFTQREPFRLTFFILRVWQAFVIFYVSRGQSSFWRVFFWRSLLRRTCQIFRIVFDECKGFTWMKRKMYMYCSISPPSYSGMVVFMGLFSLPAIDTFIGIKRFFVRKYWRIFNDIILS